MSLRKRILVHGLMAALPLALIGYLFAQMAGMWTATQSPMRIGPLHEESVKAQVEDAAAMTEKLEYRVPAVMALGGFTFVLIGEVVMSVWRRPTTLKQEAKVNSLG
ncbi:hypothetical protein BH11PLA2_BH11PLA2_50100 [soil metagenome]